MLDGHLKVIWEAILMLYKSYQNNIILGELEYNNEDGFFQIKIATRVSIDNTNSKICLYLDRIVEQGFPFVKVLVDYKVGWIYEYYLYKL